MRNVNLTPDVVEALAALLKGEAITLTLPRVETSGYAAAVAAVEALPEAERNRAILELVEKHGQVGGPAPEASLVARVIPRPKMQWVDNEFNPIARCPKCGSDQVIKTSDEDYGVLAGYYCTDCEHKEAVRDWTAPWAHLDTVEPLEGALGGGLDLRRLEKDLDKLGELYGSRWLAVDFADSQVAWLTKTFGSLSQLGLSTNPLIRRHGSLSRLRLKLADWRALLAKVSAQGLRQEETVGDQGWRSTYAAIVESIRGVAQTNAGVQPKEEPDVDTTDATSVRIEIEFDHVQAEWIRSTFGSISFMFDSGLISVKPTDSRSAKATATIAGWRSALEAVQRRDTVEGSSPGFRQTLREIESAISNKLPSSWLGPIPPSGVVSTMAPDQLGALRRGDNGRWVYCGAAEDWLRSREGTGEMAYICFSDRRSLDVGQVRFTLAGGRVVDPFADDNLAMAPNWFLHLYAD